MRETKTRPPLCYPLQRGRKISYTLPHSICEGVAQETGHPVFLIGSLAFKIASFVLGCCFDPFEDGVVGVFHIWEYRSFSGLFAAPQSDD